MLCAAAGAAAAQPAPAQERAAPAASGRFAAGTRAFEAQDYRRALVEFQAALELGADGPAVRYNIGVCHYRLGEYALAAAAFTELAERHRGMRDLAEYNLGLALTRQGRAAEARAAFERAHGGVDDRISALAAAMLERLGRSESAPARSAWAGLVDLRLGQDDNVALIDAASLPAGQSTESAFSELLLHIGGTLGDARAWRLDASAYLVTYPDAAQFDQAVVHLAARYALRAGNWSIAAGPHYSRATLDGDGLEQHAGVSVDARFTVDAAPVTLAVQWAHDEVDGIEPQFSYVEGKRDQLRFLADVRLASGRLIGEARFERNDRAAAGVSADRERYMARYRRSLSDVWTGEIVYEHRTSEYARLALPRKEVRRQIGFDVTRDFPSNWQLIGQYRYAESSSNDPLYAYERHRFAAGISKLF